MTNATRDPKTDTALCARCKRTIRLTLLRYDFAKGKHYCAGIMASSCKPIEEPKK